MEEDREFFDITEFSHTAIVFCPSPCVLMILNWPIVEINSVILMAFIGETASLASSSISYNNDTNFLYLHFNYVNIIITFLWQKIYFYLFSFLRTACITTGCANICVSFNSITGWNLQPSDFILLVQPGQSTKTTNFSHYCFHRNIKIFFPFPSSFPENKVSNFHQLLSSIM